MDIGTEFFYKVTEIWPDSKDVKIYEERYVVERVDGDSIYFSVYKDGSFERDIIGNVSYGNGHIINSHLTKQCEFMIDTESGKKKAEMLTGNRCGGSTKIFQSEGIVYRWEQTQMWSGGVIFEQEYDLTYYKIR